MKEKNIAKKDETSNRQAEKKSIKEMWQGR
jgi:hypothetical protein